MFRRAVCSYASFTATGLSWFALLGLAAELTGRTAASADDFRPTAQDRIVPPDAAVETLWLDGEFTEGPAVAADGAVYFSDIGNRILRFDPSTGSTSLFREPSGRANGLEFDSQGRLIACEGANAGGERRLSITERDGAVRTLADRWQGKRFNSPNDLAIDRQGRIFFSDPRYVGDEPRELDFEGLFVVSPDGRVELATREVNKPNGVALAPDGQTIYVADTGPAARQLLRFRIAPDGRLAQREVLVDFGSERGIDGMTTDVAGNIYAAAGRGATAGIYVFSPEGRHLARVALGGDPSNCAFGRGGQRSTLYITGQGPAPNAPTDATGGSAEAPRKHGLFRIRLAVAGE